MTVSQTKMPPENLPQVQMEIVEIELNVTQKISGNNKFDSANFAEGGRRRSALGAPAGSSRGRQGVSIRRLVSSDRRSEGMQRTLEVGRCGLLMLAVLAACPGRPGVAEGAGRAWKTVKVSDLGCPVDGVTDATSCVNDFLANASPSNPLKLVLDGTVAMKGMVLSGKGNTWIEGLGWGTGVVIEAGSNQDGIRIGAYTGGYSDGMGVARAPARGASNIILSDFTVDANGSSDSTGAIAGVTPANVPVPGAPAHPVFGVVMKDATGIVVDHVRFINPPVFCLAFANVADVTVSDSSFISSRYLQDGVHVDGPAENIRILNNVFATGDDGVALNAPEGYGGDISDVLVEGNTFQNAWTVARIYTSIKANPGDTHYARRIVFRHNRGSTQQTAFNIGVEGAAYTPAADQITDVSFEGNDISSPNGFAIMRTPFGVLRFVDNFYDAPTTRAPMIQVEQPGGREIELTGNTILRTSAGHEGAPLFSLAGGPLGGLTLAGKRVTDETGSSFAAVPYLVDIGAPTGRLRIDSVDMTQVMTLMNPLDRFQSVASVSGAGLLATKEQIEDEIVADGSTYWSATTPHAGQVCVKADGKAKPQ
jgi:hypothetical protein